MIEVSIKVGGISKEVKISSVEGVNADEILNVVLGYISRKANSDKE